MDNKTEKELGFSMNEIDDDTILIEGVVRKKVSKKQKIKVEKQFSKIALHLFDKAYIEKLQKIEVELVSNQDIFKSSIKEKMIFWGKMLMK